MNPNLILRVKDVALCLSVAKERMFYLNRIQLQKLIYLLDCLEAFFYINLVNGGHQTYFHGPYDKNIQNAADILVFRKMAKQHNIKYFDNKTITCDYEITENGEKWIRYILSNNEIALQRHELVKSLLDSLVSRNLLKDIVKLVYAEPIFVKNKVSGYGINLDFDNLDDNDVFSFMTVVLDAFKVDKTSNKVPFISDLLIEFLNKRMIALASNVEEV